MTHKININQHNNNEIVTLQNNTTTAKIAVNIGNTLFSLNHHNTEKLYFPYTLNEYKQNTKLAGNPFMHPWANRLEGEYIHFENTKYNFPKAQLPLLYRDGNNLPLHGLLLKSNQWKTTDYYEDEQECYHLATFNFNEESLLNIFPFKHTISIKHSLKNNKLSITTSIQNYDERSMPISFGYHPYFIKNTENVVLHNPAHYLIEADTNMIPNGKLNLKEQRWNFVEDTISLKDISFDDGFRNLKRDDKGYAIFSIDGTKIIFDENYPFVQIYAPLLNDRPYICIEPMTAITNALNAYTCKEIEKNETFEATFSIQL